MSTHDDDLIDRAAHAMTRGEPSNRLRHAVRARIETPRASWRLPAWVPAAVAVVVLLIVARALSGPRGEADTPRPTQVATAIAPRPTEVARAPVARALSGPRGEADTPRPTSARKSQRKLEVEPLVIEPIRMPLIAIDSSSGVMPIEIEDLRIEPLQVQ